jgi:hypothetical protein
MAEAVIYPILRFTPRREAGNDMTIVAAFSGLFDLKST